MREKSQRFDSRQIMKNNKFEVFHYKEPKTIEEAIEIFENSRDTHFESCIVDAVISAKDKIAKIDAEFKLEESESNEAEQEWWQRYHDNKNQGL